MFYPFVYQMSSESVTARAIRAKKRQSRAQLAEIDAVKRAAAAATAALGTGSGSKRKGASDKDEKQSTDEGAQKRPRMAAVAAEPSNDAAPAPAAASASAVSIAPAAAAAASQAIQHGQVLIGKEQIPWGDFDELIAREYGLLTLTHTGATSCATDFGTIHSGDYVSVNYRRDEKAETSVGFIEVDSFERDEKTGRVVVRGHWLWSLQDFRESGEMNTEIESLTADEPDVLIQSKVPHECDLSDVNGFLDENRIPTLFYDFETRDILPHERRNSARAHADHDGDSTAIAMALPAVSETDSFIGFLGAEPKFMFDNKYGASLLAYVDSKIERLHVKQARTDTTLNVPESLLKAWGHGRIVCSEMKKPHDGICGLCGRQQLLVAFMDIHSPGVTHFIDGLDKVYLDECCYETVRHIVRLRNCLSSMQARWREYDREKRRSGVYLRDWQSEINTLKLAKEARRRTYLPTEKEKETSPARAPAPAAAAAAAAAAAPAAAAAAAVAEADDADGEEEF